MNSQLLDWTYFFRNRFGVDDKSFLFYALVKMQKPQNVLELGTGLGVTALWIAEAMKENGCGHIWTVDNGDLWTPFNANYPKEMSANSEKRQRAVSHPVLGKLFFPDGIGPRVSTDVDDYWAMLNEAAQLIGVGDHISFLRGAFLQTGELGVSVKLYPYLSPVLERPIDILFADIEHSIESVLNNISQFLPMMASSSSIFIDSAATYLATYLTLEQTVHQLNSGKVPSIFLAGTNSKYKDEIIQLVATRRFTLIPLVEKKESNQNGLVWLKIEPVNIVPYPMTAMRGLKDEGLVPGKSVQELFENGRMIGSRI